MNNATEKENEEVHGVGGGEQGCLKPVELLTRGKPAGIIACGAWPSFPRFVAGFSVRVHPSPTLAEPGLCWIRGQDGNVWR